MSRPSLASPARASHIATTTLTKILELTRLHQQSQPLPSSQTSLVRRNLSTLRGLVRGLEDEQRRLEGARHRLLGEDELRSREDVLVGLQKQYGRLKALCDGLGIEAEPLEASAGEGQAAGGQHAPERPTQREELLIDAGSGDDVPLRDIQRPSGPLASGSDPLRSNAPDIRIDVPDDSAEDSRMDEEEMRIANQDVMQMQRRAMDDQDDQLDALSQAISRQRDLSLTISSELEVHEGLLEETDEALNHTDSRLRRASRSLDSVRQGTRNHSSLTAIGIIIILLVILILLIKF